MKCLIILFFFPSLFTINDGDFLSKQDKKQIEKIVHSIPDSLQTEFNTIFDQWVENWKSNPATKLSSSTNAACSLKEFEVLCDMGENIIPLIVYKLIDFNDNFIGLTLYDKLQKDDEQKVVSYTSEQDKAQKTVLLWLKKQKNK